MNAPVTVIIPCYRCASTIERAVESVAQQTRRPAQVILVDDGSDDVTPDVLLAVQKTYGADWITIITLAPNCGVSVARNAGWDAATQDYIAFLDADDIWHPNKIALQYEWMRTHATVVACGHRYVIVDPAGRLPEIPVSAPIPARPITRWRLLLSNPFVTPAVMLKRDLPYRFDPSRRYCEDYFLWMQLACDHIVWMILETPLVYVRKKIGSSGASSRLWQMRQGDMDNYRRLYQMGKLNFFAMLALIGLSMLKFLVLLIAGPQIHFALKQRIDPSGSR